MFKANKKLRARIKMQNNFRKSMGKTFHDLQSPLLSISTVATADELPEYKRVALKSATIYNNFNLIGVDVGTFNLGLAV